MNTEQETNIRMEENELNLGDILQTVLANWYWFVLSVVVCAGTAFLYLKWAPKVYTRTASVLIKDDAKGGEMCIRDRVRKLRMVSRTFMIYEL